jgi:hypothetical protein
LPTGPREGPAPRDDSVALGADDELFSDDDGPERQLIADQTRSVVLRALTPCRSSEASSS